MTETKYNYFKGIAKFVQTRKTNDYGSYSVCIQLLDDIEEKKFIDSGIQVEKTEDGTVWFRRPETKLIKNELVKFGPPLVVDKDGNPSKEMIGTGSEVIVKVRSYPTMKGTGHTWDAIQIIKLVPVELSVDGERYNF